MNIYTVIGTDLTDFILTGMQSCRDADLIVFGFDSMERLDFSNELAAEKSRMYDLSLLSKNLSCAVAAGAETVLLGTVRKSVIVCDAGRVLGISDETFSLKDGKYRSGFGYRVYDTAAGMFGSVIGEDVKYPLPAVTIGYACGEFLLIISDEDYTREYAEYCKAVTLLSKLPAVVVTRDNVFCCEGGEVSKSGGEGISLIRFKPASKFTECTVKKKCW